MAKDVKKRPTVGDPRLTVQLRNQYGRYNERIQTGPGREAPLSVEDWLRPDFGMDKNGNVFRIKQDTSHI